MTTNPTNYTEFWDFYVSEHSLPMTRALHFVGTSLGIALALPILYIMVKMSKNEPI